MVAGGMTHGQVAEVLGMSCRTIWRWTRQKRIDAWEQAKSRQEDFRQPGIAQIVIAKCGAKDRLIDMETGKEADCQQSSSLQIDNPSVPEDVSKAEGQQATFPAENFC